MDSMKRAIAFGEAFGARFFFVVAIRFADQELLLRAYIATRERNVGTWRHSRSMYGARNAIGTQGDCGWAAISSGALYWRASNPCLIISLTVALATSVTRLPKSSGLVVRLVLDHRSSLRSTENTMVSTETRVS
jgi:hypothetical protein